MPEALPAAGSHPWHPRAGTPDAPDMAQGHPAWWTPLHHGSAYAGNGLALPSTGGLDMRPESLDMAWSHAKRGRE